MTSPQHPSRPSVLVIGAGFAGLGVATQLKTAGYDDVTILERSDDIGGVWRDNVYPDAACDVPSSLYSWSWAPNPDWGRRYAKQPDILAYIHREADRLDLRRHVVTGAEVVAADWTGSQWKVRTADGRSFSADVLVPAVGQLSNPVVPDVPGEFAGPSFHSAEWPDIDLRGKRVAVVGTGASAIQFVPGIVDDVAAMTVFQRSAAYVVPKTDRAYTALHHRAFRALPATQGFGRSLTWHVTELFNRSFINPNLITRALKLAWRAQMHRAVRDPELRRKLEPDYTFGCKRVLFSNDWYPALARPHVDVTTERVVGLEEQGVRTADGVLHEVDVVIWGTGFAATDFLAGVEVTGVDGVRLAEEWVNGAHAHLGITVPGFPNLFVMYGPNTNLGGSSIIGMLEAQGGYVVQAVEALAAGAPPLSVRRDVATAWDKEMQSRLVDSVWASCANWYTTATGRVTTNWPGLVQEYKDRTARFDANDFEQPQPTR